MASRSTRRRLKNSEMPKLEECENEEEPTDDKQSNVGRRRSLRHSPGSSSVSPPRKARRLKEGSDVTESKAIKSAQSPSKSSKSSVKSPSQGLKTLKEESNEVLTPKRNTRNSPSSLNSTPVRMTRNSSLTSNSPSKKNISKVMSSTTDSSLGSPRRNTRSKVGNSPGKEEDEVNIKDEKTKACMSNSSQEKNLDQTPSTSQDRKRSLSLSPELSITENTNGNSVKQSPVRSSKRKCLYSIKETEATANGKSDADSFSNCEEKKIENDSSISDSSSNSITSNCNTSTLTPASDNFIQSNGKDSGKDAELSPKKVKVSNKRSLIIDSPESNESSSKKYKSIPVSPKHNITDSSTTQSRLGKESKGQQLLVSSTNTKLEKSTKEVACLHKDSMDTSNNAELLLIEEFGLTESQCKDVCSVLSYEMRDSNCIDIVEDLVKKLLTESTSLPSMSSPRFNKLLRQLLIKYCTSNKSVEKKHHLCEGALEWSKERKSVNLRHELELALMTLYYDTGFYRKAEETATGLYKETKKLQDKEKTVKACLCLSKAYHAMGNISKARANITTAKTEALKIYTPPDLQGELDLQSGIMQVAEEKDMETAFSYFKEAATGFSVQENRSKALKYMLLTKLLVNRPSDGEKAVRSQCHVEDIDSGVEAMLSITKAAVTCSLADFKKAREQYGNELEEDLVVKGVLDQLYSKMLEKNLLSIVAPYERMQISVVADKIGLGRDEVERRLSQMILDGEIRAQLDHRDDCLYVYQAEEKDSVYEHGLETVSQLDRTLSLLNRRVKQLL
ncbi:UNVERIFIED_CONTAM: hypothetical protein GTU68_030480 [Idotea baltica]|nr:hypothetical protein [Idotea baltica]